MNPPDPRPVVAETLRVAAFWLSNDGDKEALLGASRNVLHMRQDDACCALCEEVTCDTGCPMEAWRDQ